MRELAAGYEGKKELMSYEGNNLEAQAFPGDAVRDNPSIARKQKHHGDKLKN
jgi:hypothetical protein